MTFKFFFIIICTPNPGDSDPGPSVASTSKAAIKSAQAFNSTLESILPLMPQQRNAAWMAWTSKTALRSVHVPNSPYQVVRPQISQQPNGTPGPTVALTSKAAPQSAYYSNSSYAINRPQISQQSSYKQNNLSQQNGSKYALQSAHLPNSSYQATRRPISQQPNGTSGPVALQSRYSSINRRQISQQPKLVPKNSQLANYDTFSEKRKDVSQNQPNMRKYLGQFMELEGMYL